jgi:prepilin peptidase CpaA
MFQLFENAEAKGYAWVFILCVVAFTLVAAVMDLRTRRLPNWLTVSAWAVAIVFHSVTSGLSGLAMALAGFAAGFGILLVLWLIGGGGGGDVKLMGALGAWLGVQLTVVVFVLSTVLAVFAAIIALCLRAAQRGLPAAMRGKRREKSNNRAADQEEKAKRRLLPYALPVAVGTWMVLAWTVVVHGS